MADTQHLLCLNPSVGNNADNGGHEDGDDALYRIEDTNLTAQSMRVQVGAHTSQISPPDGKLEEIHENEPEFYVLHIKSHDIKGTNLEEVDIQGNLHAAEVSALVEFAEAVLRLALALEIVGE